MRSWVSRQFADVKGNVKWDALKWAGQSAWPWAWGAVSVGLVMLSAWLRSQPPGFWLMLAVFWLALVLASIARMRGVQDTRTIASRRRVVLLVVVAGGLVPAALFWLSRVSTQPYEQPRHTSTPPPAPRITQTSGDNSPCSNVVAGRGVEINCSPSDKEIGEHERKAVQRK